jgi:carbon storage regulator
MLILSRKAGERVLIGDSIWLTIVRVDGNQVRVGIEAPRSIPVLRQELAARRAPPPVIAGSGRNTVCTTFGTCLPDLALA